MDRTTQMLKEERELAQAQMSDELLNELDYDSGLINDYGGGNVGWWMDYIRVEINNCNEYWRSIISTYGTK